MNGDFFVLTVLLLVLVADVLARNLLNPKKSAGLLTLFTLALAQKPSLLRDKKTALRRLLLSTFAGICLFWCVSLTPMSDPLLMVAIPLFVMPFYYFIYSCQTINFIQMSACLQAFRARGLMGVLLISNIVFIKYGAKVSMFNLLIHATFAWLALAYFFYLCAQPRQVPSSANVLTLEDYDHGLMAFLNYAISCLEICFYVIIFFVIFVRPNYVLFDFKPTADWDEVAILVATLVVLAVTSRILFYRRATWAHSFFEKTLLPISFIIFALSSVFTRI